MSTQNLLMCFCFPLLAAVMANLMIKDTEQYQEVVLSIMAKLAIMEFKLLLVTSLFFIVISVLLPSFASELTTLICITIIKHEAALESYFIQFVLFNISVYLSLLFASQISNKQRNRS